MVSHAVRRLLELAPADATGHVVATVELGCGCQITCTLREDRIVDRPGGERFAVGKVPCPRGHPVVDPSRGSSGH